MLLKKHINFINPEIEISEDGSNTLIHPIIKEAYHSTNGAVGETCHIYINNGVELFFENNNRNCDIINILEMGFGSGLNALMTIDWAIKNKININYTTIELYPIDIDVIKTLSYDKYVSPETYEIFIKMHLCEWNKKIKLTDTFSILKIEQSLTEIDFISEGINNIDIVYFDAFAPTSQPQLWSKDVFSNIFLAMANGGHLVTYSAKGIVKQALRDSGFEVKRLKGALGKHHMLLCIKP